MEIIPEISQMPILYYILTALIAVGLCTLAGVVVCCIFMLTLRWKKRTQRESNFNHEYYEVIDPIYEGVISTAITDSNHSGTQIRTENNNAYKSVSVKENEAYIHITSQLDALQMDPNKSYVYQASPFNFNIPVIPEGLTTTEKCYETQSLHSNENIQQVTGRVNVPVSENNEQVEFQSPGQSSVDINNSAAIYGSTELTFEPQLQGVYKPGLSCEKQSINLQVIESHTEQ